MAEFNEKTGRPITPTGSDGVTEVRPDIVVPRGVKVTKKIDFDEHDGTLQHELVVTEDDLLEAKAFADTLTLERVRELMVSVLKIHERDPNFPHSILKRIQEFMENEAIFENPEKHEDIIEEMKLEAALITNNSPYAEVRAVVDNKDDPSTPVSTIRAWTIGIAFSVLLAFINQLFSIRQPAISIESNVVQLLAYPLGKAWEHWMPTGEFTLFGRKHFLNPGKFNKKEHMLIAIMANTAKSLPYTQYIVWTQVLPQYFNQQYARSFGYQILIAISTNFIGYGLAGLTRRFIVYPTYCVWPASLTTIALNSALHNDTNPAVPGPFNRIYRASRFKFFMIAFTAMFVYFWFPNFIFEALTYFSWMTWIAPDNRDLNILTGFNSGLGLLNPWPTFDWNVLLYDSLDPLMVPAFSTINRALGMFIFGFVILAVWYTNTWNTGYLPINTNRVYDHFGQLYNVSRALNEKGMYDHEKYMNYSAAYLGAANTIVYGCFFAIYSAAITYIILFHRYEITVGFKNLWANMRRRTRKAEGEEYQDVHNRLMSAYPEVSEWYYLSVLLIAAGFGFGGVAGWPTFTTPGVVPYGILLALIFVIPVGIIKAMTGVEVTLNVLAEFIGGMWVGGNALAMNFFKSFGYVTCAHAIQFSQDLKLAHYLKIPPWHTFIAQLAATMVSTLVCTGVINFQVDIENVCQKNAPMRFFCPGPNTFFTASVLWGTIGPIKVFGHQGQYKELLLGFPAGIVLTIGMYLVAKRFPKNETLRQFHPVAFWYGPLAWAPYSFSYAMPSIPIALLSWVYVRKRYLAFWSKYNFVLSAAFSAGIAIAGIIMLFSVQWVRVSIPWWGNEQPYMGCEGEPCLLKTLEDGERFFPWWDGNVIPAP
ncbi:OPT oligopeptide transporter protein-domain-containing protein [Lasiosphaeris hirsuta]|uniref:OPT oligopeptide transporter protein-domain-containing protein n=1 Tax=Lasiosphaeris hirsuta TaxID=260670 RepID=A0AA40A7I8_9PEZI|nr:OPT oligopeptide transporter protein-domain-containing protein [Lasiosphaeris hirsuta]